MRGGSNGFITKIASPNMDAHSNKSCTTDTTTNHVGVFSKTVDNSKKGGSLSGSGETPSPPQHVWPPKFVIGLTNKEKEEDFIALKGCKLPLRPKKRAKFIQRTLNLVSPGTWLCDLTLERYEVKEKKKTKKRPSGLKAMSQMDPESE